jgi:hypothetical protein
MQITTILPAVDRPALLACEVCRELQGEYRIGNPQVVYFPTDMLTSDVVKTKEWFGGDTSTFRLVLVSQRFVRLVLHHRWRGVHFEPIDGRFADRPC